MTEEGFQRAPRIRTQAETETWQAVGPAPSPACPGGVDDCEVALKSRILYPFNQGAKMPPGT